jgi:quercetin dioxygenase-like cupin family protein
MERRPSGARVTRARDAASDPIDVFAELFEEPAGAITTFRHRLDGHEFLAAHFHTAPLAARIDSGEIVFALPGEQEEPITLGPGDFVWIPAGLIHEERVTGDEAVGMLVAHVETFGTEPA